MSNLRYFSLVAELGAGIFLAAYIGQEMDNKGYLGGYSMIALVPAVIVLWVWRASRLLSKEDSEKL